MRVPRAVGNYGAGFRELPSTEGTEGVNLQMAQLIETLSETNIHLKSIADVGTDTLGFVRRWVPWAIAFAGVLWPAVGKVISGLPAWPS